MKQTNFVSIVPNPQIWYSMKQKVIRASYNGTSIRFESLQDELAYRDNMLHTIRSYTNCRAKWILEHSHIPAAVYAIDALRQFTGAYHNHSLLAVAKRTLALQDKLYVLMPNPTGYMSHWCTKIETLLKISKAIINDESYYISGQRYQPNVGSGQLPKSPIATHSV